MQTEPFTLKGEVALVTGGATGIGRAIASALAHQGAHVVIVGRRQEALDEACTALGKEVSSRNYDVTKYAKAPALLADIGWAAAYLCSPSARFITGICLPVDGGASIGF